MESKIHTMTRYSVYLTYGRYGYPSPKIVMHENKGSNVITIYQTIQDGEIKVNALKSQNDHEVRYPMSTPSSQGIPTYKKKRDKLRKA